QMFYYFFAYKALRKSHPDLVFSVPSGNFGNICAGIMGQKLGLPVRHFIAANNANDVVTEYLKTERYQPKPSVQTISNAMDVGNPSNFVRILEIYNNDFNVLKNNLSSYSFSDSDTQSAMQELYNDFNYVADPHGAVGYLGCKRYLKSDPGAHCVFLETAHPSKFLDVVEDTIKQNIVLPPQIISVMEKKKKAIAISSYEELKEFLINN
ncbi:MAG TPA: pyridoxal-phosphate dependent enzyme, partial [Aquaticitalea sp.]|nr:pyridoxal-phosphate dependent enzyme [Aquaticitalea sp.]